jgi:DNA-binding IclR family transcriptional regulator
MKQRIRKRAAAPAVDNAFRILRHLCQQPAGAGVSAIGRALGISKSSCFKILETMARHEAVTKQPQTAAWRLGSRLVELGAATRHSYPSRDIMRSFIQPIVDEYGVACVIGQVLADDSGIVLVDRLVPRNRPARVILLPIGQIFGFTTPALGRAILAMRSDEEALALAAAQGGFTRPEARAELLQRLAEIRRQGFAVSFEEYAPGVNAVGCAVPGKGGDAASGFALMAEKRVLSRRRALEIGQRLALLVRRSAMKLPLSDEA